MVSFRDIETPQQALDWTEHLNNKWPERVDVIDHIVAQVQALPFSDTNLVELCTGAGALATALLSALRHNRCRPCKGCGRHKPVWRPLSKYEQTRVTNPCS